MDDETRQDDEQRQAEEAAERGSDAEEPTRAGSADVDEGALDEAAERIEQAGGGH